MKNYLVTLGLPAIVAVAATFSNTALAIACNADATGKVMGDAGAVACDTGTTNNDFLGDPLQVNIDTMFDIDTWMFAEKDEDLAAVGTDITTIDVGLAVDGLEGGNWSLRDDIWDLYENVMLVIKGGQGNNSNPNYVGYLLDVSSGTSGTYSTPFFNVNGGGAGNPKAISHITCLLYTSDAADD